MSVYTIPVAFAVNAESEMEAAKLIVDMLAKADIVNENTDHPNWPVDCWWTPNHPEADGSDTNDPFLMWVEPGGIYKPGDFIGQGGR